MSAGTLLLDVVLATATALLYVYVGVLTLRRHASDAASRTALRLFALWWIGLAAITFQGVLQTSLAWSGNLDVPTYKALSTLSVFPLVAILAGLVSYLAYIYSGSSRVFVPIALFHLGALVYFLYLNSSLDPETIKLGTWGVEVTFREDIDAGTTGTVFAVLLLPALISAIGYASLYFRTKDRSARYRIAMVSGAFLFWFGSSGIAGLTDLADWEYWPPVSRGIALVSTLMVLAAYRPPGWARARWGLRSTDETRDGERSPGPWKTAKATLLRLGARALGARMSRDVRLQRISGASGTSAG